MAKTYEDDLTLRIRVVFQTDGAAPDDPPNIRDITDAFHRWLGFQEAHFNSLGSQFTHLILYETDETGHDMTIWDTKTTTYLKGTRTNG